MGSGAIGEGGGNEHEEIEVHLVPRADIPAFVERKRAEGCAIDVKMLLLLAAEHPRLTSFHRPCPPLVEIGCRGFRR